MTGSFKVLAIYEVIMAGRILHRFISILAIVILLISCEKNHPPIIASIKQEPMGTSAGTIYKLQVDVTDEDGDLLEYAWSSDGGDFLSPVTLKEVEWRSPADGEGKSFSITIAVTDGEFEVSKEHQIGLTEPILGGIIGTVCYSNTMIPIEGVEIGIAGNRTITDSKGDYSLSGLVARNDTLIASKKDFAMKKVVVAIPPDAVLHYDFEMLSVALSSKVSGQVTDQEDLPVKNAEVLVINPNGIESRLRAFTDDNGHYRILYVPHGERNIIVRKAINEDFRYIEIEEEIVFGEIEQKVDFVMEKIYLKGTVIDDRDGREYPYKTIGNQTWMITNLSYLPEVSPAEEMSDTRPLYYVYDYSGSDTAEAKNLEKFRNYGVLYNWPAAKKACPKGWHLPTKGEWNTLVYELYPNSAAKMRTTSGWLSDEGASNSSGFSAVPAGHLNYEGDYTGIGMTTYFYTASEYSASISWFNSISSGSFYLWPQTGPKKIANSVRCLRDD